MKKKILFGLGALAIAAVLAVNVNMARNEQNVTLSLEQLGKTPAASAESSDPRCPVYPIPWHRTYNQIFWECYWSDRCNIVCL
ncbi:MAG: hypothetical protein EHM93_15860 [Bacteroidales bacterium]|nr:MAG: hypothetical protein EHM93_15860 [Bacteroidales bacterium]